MEMKRSRSIWFCHKKDKEKKKQECRDRIQSQKEKKSSSFVMDQEGEQEHDNSGDADDDDSEEGDNHNVTSTNRVLSVSCGARKGKLDVEKLERGEECIEYEGRWFSPVAFESFCGKSTSKKWKCSITHRDKPLQFWFKQGCLSTKGYKRGTQRKKTSGCGSWTCSEDDSERQSTKESEGDDGKHNDGPPSSKKWTPNTEKTKDGCKNCDRDVKVKVKESEIKDEDFSEDHKFIIGMNNEWEVSAPEIVALKTEVKVLINRLPLAELEAQIESPGVKWYKPFNDDGNSGETDNSSEEIITDIREGPLDEPQDSDSTVIGDVKEENGEEFITRNSREEREAETAKEVCQSVSGNKNNNKEVKKCPSPGPRPSLDPVATEEDSDMTDVEEEVRRVEILDQKDANQTKRKEQHDASEDGETSGATGKRLRTSRVSPDRSFTPVDVFGPLCLAAMPPDVLRQCHVKNHADATIADLETAPLQVMVSDTRAAGTFRASAGSPLSPPRVLSGSENSTLDMKQLKREIIHMQMKVLKLQEEYYTLKLREFKQKAATR